MSTPFPVPMPIAIVDDLEIVDVEQNEGQGLSITICSRYFPTKIFLVRAMVSDACEVVG